MTNTTTMTASEAKIHFGEALNQCLYAGRDIIITKHEKPVAVLIKLDKWKETEGESRKKVPPLFTKIIALRNSMQKHAKQKDKKMPSSVELVRQIREEAS